MGLGLGVGFGGSVQNIVLIIFTRKTSVVIHSGGAGGWNHSDWRCGLGMVISGGIVIVMLGLLVWLGGGLRGGSSVLRIV